MSSGTRSLSLGETLSAYERLDDSASDDMSADSPMSAEARQMSLQRIRDAYEHMDLPCPEDESEAAPIGPSKPWRKAHFISDESMGPSDPKKVTRIGHARIKEYGKPTCEVHDDILGLPIDHDTPVEERFAQKGVKVVREFCRVRGEKELVSTFKAGKKCVKMYRRVVVRDAQLGDGFIKFTKFSPKKIAVKAVEKLLETLHMF